MAPPCGPGAAHQFDAGHQLSQLIGRATTPLASTVAAALKG
jgi:NAD(P)H dehydrogenase (quinone)